MCSAEVEKINAECDEAYHEWERAEIGDITKMVETKKESPTEK